MTYEIALIKAPDTTTPPPVGSWAGIRRMATIAILELCTGISMQVAILLMEQIRPGK
jgi:hypothetical protein